MNDTRTDVTSEVVDTTIGRPAGRSAEELLPQVYENLRRLAARYMQRERAGHTLQPTAVVHDAYLKLADQKRAEWKSETHFVAVGAQVMRRILVDHAREHAAEKRGAGWHRVTLSANAHHHASEGMAAEELLDLNAALEHLAELDPRQANIVTLRYFGGLTVAQVAQVLGVSKRTVEGDWKHARAWLKLELGKGTTA